MSFKTFKVDDDTYECHGCGSGKNLTGIILPNLCNQPLVLCSDCKTKLYMTIKENRIIFVNGYPYCSEHGAMNKVSKHGMWRCLSCHIGYDEARKLFLKDSSEGFRNK